MSFRIDLNRLRLDQRHQPAAEASPARLPRHRPGEQFLRGPIPCSWLEAAAKLPGKALHVGIALWFQAGMLKANRVRLTGKLTRRFGTLPDAKQRAIAQLEAAGLVSVERGAGRNPIVTIMPAPTNDAAC